MTTSSTAEREPLSRRIPHRIMYQSPYNRMIGQMPSLPELQNKILDSQGWTGRRLMGFKLPEWQRPEVWTTEQCVRFIESAWLGLGLGTYMVNSTLNTPETDLVLLDGQQRLRSIERYFNSEFPVCGEDGKPYLWGELTEREQASLYRIPFPWIETNYRTERELRDAYNRHNFGGTPHSPDQRA